VVRPQWQGSASQERDARKRRTPGSRLLGKLPFPQAADRAMLTLDEQAVALAVIASVRHEDTAYDDLLMTGVPRLDARARVRDTVERTLREWRSPPAGTSGQT